MKKYKITPCLLSGLYDIQVKEGRKWRFIEWNFLTEKEATARIEILKTQDAEGIGKTDNRR